jgi:hypothetical protein
MNVSSPVRRLLGRAIPTLILSLTLTQTIPGRAVAGPPFQTDDPEPTPYRHYEIYINSQFAHDGDILSGTLPALEVNYGLMPNVQFSVTGSLAGSHVAGEPWNLGFGDTEIALKMRFVQESAATPQIAFYPSVVIPADAKLGTGAGPPKIFLPFWAQKSFGPWTISGGGGFWHNPGIGKRDYAFTGLALQRDLSENLSVGAEMFHSGASTTGASAIGDSASTGFSVGLIQGLGPYHKVLFSIGRGLSGTNVLSTYAAYELYLGPSSPKTTPATPVPAP